MRYPARVVTTVALLAWLSGLGAARQQLQLVLDDSLRGGSTSGARNGGSFEADAAGSPGVRERWTVDFGPKELVFSVNGKTVLRHPHGLTIAPEYFVELQGTAKPDAPAGARVRFDSVRIEQ